MGESVREGQAVGMSSVFGQGTPSLYHARATHPEIARWWDPWMDSFNDASAIRQRLSRLCHFKRQEPQTKGLCQLSGRVLEWCGNDGKNAIRLAQLDETLNITLIDLPQQVAKANQRIAEAGLQERITTLGVDLMDTAFRLNEEYDGVTMIHTIREWSHASLRRFFGLIHIALK